MWVQSVSRHGGTVSWPRWGGGLRRRLALTLALSACGSRIDAATMARMNGQGVVVGADGAPVAVAVLANDTDPDGDTPAPCSPKSMYRLADIVRASVPCFPLSQSC